MNFGSHAETLRWLESQGFPVIPGFMVCQTGDEVWQAITRIGENRSRLSYGIDGAVVKLDNLADRERLGTTSKVPRWAVAYKYPPEEKETILEEIQIHVGRTGKLTPTAIFKPVRLAGTTVTRATLHNQDIIDAKDVKSMTLFLSAKRAMSFRRCCAVFRSSVLLMQYHSGCLIGAPFAGLKR